MRAALLKKFLFYLILLSAFFIISFDAAALPRSEVQISSSRISLDETTTLNIRMEWPKSEGAYSFALPEPILKNLTLVRQGESQGTFVEKEAEWTQKTFTLEFKGVKPGEALIRSFVLPYVNSEGQTSGNFTVGEQTVLVNAIPFYKRINFMAIAALLMLLGFASAAAFFSLKIKGRQAKSATAPAPPSAEQIAAEKMKAVIEKSAGRPRKEMLYELGLEFRKFIAESYHIQSAASTEAEWMDLLEKASLPRGEFERLKHLLQGISEGKFMADAMSEADFKQLQRELLSFIEGKRIVSSNP